MVLNWRLDIYTENTDVVSLRVGVEMEGSLKMKVGGGGGIAGDPVYEFLLMAQHSGQNYYMPVI